MISDFATDTSKGRENQLFHPTDTFGPQSRRQGHRKEIHKFSTFLLNLDSVAPQLFYTFQTMTFAPFVCAHCKCLFLGGSTAHRRLG